MRGGARDTALPAGDTLLSEAATYRQAMSPRSAAHTRTPVTLAGARMGALVGGEPKYTRFTTYSIRSEILLLQRSAAQVSRSGVDMRFIAKRDEGVAGGVKHRAPQRVSSDTPARAWGHYTRVGKDIQPSSPSARKRRATASGRFPGVAAVELHFKRRVGRPGPAATGKSTTNVAPAPSALSTEIVPPWARTVSRAR